MHLTEYTALVRGEGYAQVRDLLDAPHDEVVQLMRDATPVQQRRLLQSLCAIRERIDRGRKTALKREAEIALALAGWVQQRKSSDGCLQYTCISDGVSQSEHPDLPPCQDDDLKRLARAGYSRMPACITLRGRH